MLHRLFIAIFILSAVLVSAAVAFATGRAIGLENDHVPSDDADVGLGLSPQAVSAAASLATGSAFTYQGRLTTGGSPYDGSCDFDFYLFDAAGDGNEVGTQVTLLDQPVADGLFTVTLDFGPGVFSGEARWLEIRVRCPAGSSGWTILAPRQRLTAVPYAATAATALGLEAGTVVSGTVPSGPALSLANDSTEGGFGVRGFFGSEAGYGVAGFQSGYDAADNEFWEAGGIFGGRNGVVGMSEEDGGYAIFGQNNGASDGGWAGRFRAENGDGVWISAPSGEIGLSVTGGSKNAAVATGDGARLLYTEESTEVWFTDYGFGQLSDGVAVIAIDRLFAETVNLTEPYHVFVQAYGDAELYVASRTPTQFEVHLRAGDPSVEFSYRLVAKRVGYEGARLERAPWADRDPSLFPSAPLTEQEQP